MIGIRTYIELGLGFIIMVAVVCFALHERHIQEVKDHDATAAQIAAARELAAAKSQANIDRSKAAEDAQQRAQSLLDSYIAAHPMGIVRVCIDGARNPHRVSATGAGSARIANTGTGPAAISAVPAGTASADISAGLAVIVSSAGRLATLYAEEQQR